MGAAPNPTNLLTWPGHQPKTGKNATPTYILHLAPSVVSDQWNACMWATPGCANACLNTAGRGHFSDVQRGRVLKTLFLGANPNAFLGLLTHEIDLAVRRHSPEPTAVRLNGTSDLRWERFAPWLFTRWDDSVIFYDYTKSPNRVVPDNYHLTFSASERADFDLVKDRLKAYGRVAMVFDTPKNVGLPDWWGGIPVIDGDKDDQRWTMDGVIVGLRAKGKAIGDTSGFVLPGCTTTEPDDIEWGYRLVHIQKKEIAA